MELGKKQKIRYLNLKIVMEIKNDEYEELFNNGELKILCFKSTWCGPCKVLEPILNDIIIKNVDLDIYKIDVDNNPLLCGKYGIRNIPTTIFLKDKEIVDKFVGAQSQEFIQDKIDRLK